MNLSRQSGTAMAFVMLMAAMPLVAGLAQAQVQTQAPRQGAGPQVATTGEPQPIGAPDPGGVPVALLGSGVDDTKSEIARCLARDGEGEPIARDFADDDLRPYNQASASTADAIALCRAERHLRLIVIRERPGDRDALGHMVMFAARTPARIVVWPDADTKRPDWTILPQVVKLLPHLLFVVPQTWKVKSSPSGPGIENEPNLIATPRSGNQPARDRSLALTRQAARLLAAEPGLTAKDLKTRLAVAPRP